MADEEVMGSASPAPSDHKRKLDDLDSETFEHPPLSTDYNGNSEAVADADGDADDTEDPDVKRPRLDDNSDGFDSTNNGHQEEETEEPEEDIDEPSPVLKNTGSEEEQEKIDEPLDAVNNESVADELLDSVNKESVTDEPLDAVNKESATDELDANPLEQQFDGNFEESVRDEHQESELNRQDHTPDADEYGTGLNEQATSSDQPTSRRMEVPSNKVGVLIGKGGDTIRTLQYSSGARIQITRDSEADPNSTTRPVELIGTLDNINKAERLIKEVIAEADAGGSPSLVARGFSAHSGSGEQVHIQVPNEKVGVIIGKGGETIKNLQTRSGARIQLIPQHLPEGDQSKERTVRVTGDRRQIEAAKEMIREVMEQPIPMRSSTPSGGGNHSHHHHNNHRQRGSGPNNWGPRNNHSSQQSGYNNYPPRGAPYQSQNQQYPSQQSYNNYPPQQPLPKNNYNNWDQRPPPEHQQQSGGYDYYNNHQPSPQPPPAHSYNAPPPNNYGPPQAHGPSDYGQPPPQYSQTTPQGYGQGYGEPRYDHQAPPPVQAPPPAQHPYGGQGTQSNYPQGYGQQDQYGKPQPYNAPPYGQTYAQPRQQPPPTQQYPQYSAPPVNDGGYGGYPPQTGGQPVSGYSQSQTGGPTSNYGQPVGPTTNYGQYPSTQPGYTEQPAPNSTGYGYQAAPDPAYGGGYGAPAPVQPAYTQPAPVPAPVQPGYDQSVPQTGGYVAQPPVQPQQGYGQYDSNQMYR